MITQITFRTVTGGDQTIATQDYEKRAVFEKYNPTDTALSGKLRDQIKGVRREFSISYSHSIEAGTYRSILNNIASDLRSGNDEITISEGSSISDPVVVVPTEEFRQQIQYDNTISRFFPTIRLIEVQINGVTGSYVNDGYVNFGYVQ